MYALPNLYGEDPAVQISVAYAREGQVDEQLEKKVKELLIAAKIEPKSQESNLRQLLLRFPDTQTQLTAYSALKGPLAEMGFVVAQNLAPSTPGWLSAFNAQPMSLGLDLRGGVHFLMAIDMETAITQDEENFVQEFRSLMRQNKLRYKTVRRLKAGGVQVGFKDEAVRDQAVALLSKNYPDLLHREEANFDGHFTTLSYSEKALKEVQDMAIEQNISTLRNRVNELGVAEPVIQRQGDDRIVVQLPGVQDTARAKEILGSTATLEYRLVTDAGPNAREYKSRNGGTVWLKRSVIVTGDQINHAASTIDQRTAQPAVVVHLDSKGAKRMFDTTKANVLKPMAVVFIETTITRKTINGKETKIRNRKEEVISVATIQEPFGKQFQTTGLEQREAVNLALLLRAGALKAPIEIVEERTIGPSLGQENIDQGFKSIVVGFLLVLIFMVLRYSQFGMVANVALLLNVVIVIALLSLIQATLTLPGIAGILLTIGMAIDANVLIFERILEEERNGNSPQASIHAGYEKAFGTIVDANITTLLAAIVLLSFGTGPVKGFAVTLALGIIASMFTAIMVSRAIINGVYGRRKLHKLPL
ncbi:protein translocase subunit SecD [Candidatus Venteria ishoeyi]|uniref:Protein translocase subunit SecD n=1 Tax=Candidatus Venteria ishoeyi TaxID=1899563 RepID=A0A1H6F9V7_9GAMM|nr:protein translocase subunit SecD [Candidatus Venteria ishoeyi]SEH06877.1 preprotein translocase subunit SecD [Candidatus Venteria ishoeyi]